MVYLYMCVFDNLGIRYRESRFCVARVFASTWGQILTTLKSLLICRSKFIIPLRNNFVQLEKRDWSFWFRLQWKQPLDM